MMPRDHRLLTRALCAVVICVSTAASASAYDPIRWAPSLAEAQRTAREQNRMVLIHFWSENCGPCLRLDKTVFKQREFVNAVHGNYIPVKVNTREHYEIAQQFNVTRIPTDVILMPDGREIHRSISPAETDRYISLLDEVAAHQHLGRVATVGGNIPLSDTVTIANENNPTMRPPQQGAQPPVQPRAVENPFAQRGLGNGIGGAEARGEGRQAQQGLQGQRETEERGLSRYSAPPVAGAAIEEPMYNGPAAERQLQDLKQSLQPNVPIAPENMQAKTPSNTASNAMPQRLQQDPRFQPDPRVANLNRPTNFAPGETSHPPLQTQRPAQAQQSPQLQQTPQRPAPIVTPPAPPPVGLDGFCPVSLVMGDRWTPGDPRWHATFEQRTYYFAGPEQREQFLRQPARFCPAMSGYDIVRYRETGVLVPGKREHGVFAKDENGQTRGYYLFADEASLEKFCRAGQAEAPPQRR